MDQTVSQQECLKQLQKNIAPSVTNLFNISLKTGCFPASWKLSHIVPIPKLNVPTNHGLSNYQPISLLPILSKILERHVYTLITDHLSNNCPISDQQWGFQGKKSTILALLSAAYDWFKTKDTWRRNWCFDIKKVPHCSLIKKLKALNISPLIIRCDIQLPNWTLPNLSTGTELILYADDILLYK